MNPAPKILIISGIILIAIGLLWHLGGKFLPLGRLPGDILIERERFRFYFPIATSIIISIVLTLLFFIIGFFRK